MNNSNANRILDEGKIKCIDHLYMSRFNVFTEYERAYIKNELLRDELCQYHTDLKHNQYVRDQIRALHENGLYPDPAKIEKLERSIKSIPSRPPRGFVEGMVAPDDMNKEALYRYFNLTIFNRCMMFNVSPNWKGDCSLEEHALRIDHMNKFIRQWFRDCNRWSWMSYVIECGSEANFTHAHIVVELNPECYKSTMALIKRGNHLREMRKIWNKLGYKGLIDNRVALQSTIINTKGMLTDKLNYLVEEKKPMSHRNADHELYPIYFEKIML